MKIRYLCRKIIKPQAIFIALSLILTLTSCMLPIKYSPNQSIDSALANRCEKAWESPFGPGIPYELQETYGNQGCKLIVTSENNKNLAYVTLATTKIQNDFYVDTVKIISLEKNIENIVHQADSKNHIGKLEWSKTGKLMVWEKIWEGDWVLYIYDPFTMVVDNVMRANNLNEIVWNTDHNKFYVSHSGQYGHTVCITELGGYDFQNGNRFPDFYEIYKLEKTNDDPFGIPYGKNNNLSIEPFACSADGNKLWVTITPLKLLENGYYSYELGPKQAGVLSFTVDGITFTLLASDPVFDYSFQGVQNPQPIFKSYSPTHCPVE